MSEEQERNPVKTTGHQWDDEEGYPLREYNNPLPRWWLYTFYASIIYALVYWVLYPAWPLLNDFTKGTLGWSMYQELEEEMAAAKAMQRPFNEKLAALSLEEIIQDNKLYQYAISGGHALFGDNCAPCHGSGGVGSHAKGFPNLVDDDWLFGGTLADITETLNQGRTGMMPVHLESAGGSFSEAQVRDLAQYVLSLTNKASDPTAVERGTALFHGDAGCNGCHGDHGKGSAIDTVAGEPIDHSVGAPNLADAIWLYGGDPETVFRSVARGRTGKMPAWGEGYVGFGKRLDPLAIKQLVLYVHSLGGTR
jgi:cytochrome c oxidase cbb3-type subunit 3